MADKESMALPLLIVEVESVQQWQNAMQGVERAKARDDAGVETGGQSEME